MHSSNKIVGDVYEGDIVFDKEGWRKAVNIKKKNLQEGIEVKENEFQRMTNCEIE